jgi:hypothetical protein
MLKDKFNNLMLKVKINKTGKSIVFKDTILTCMFYKEIIMVLVRQLVNLKLEDPIMFTNLL